MKFIFFCLFLMNANATTFLLVRHGETDWNKHKIWNGTSDVSLNETGRSQAAILAKNLANQEFHLCFASHLIRAKETAAILTNLPVQVDERLRERTFKCFDDIPFGTCTRFIEKQYENPALVRARVFECLEEIALNHPQKRILVATHGGIIKQILMDIHSPNSSPKKIQVPNTATLEIHYSNGAWTIGETKNIEYLIEEDCSDDY